MISQSQAQSTKAEVGLDSGSEGWFLVLLVWFLFLAVNSSILIRTLGGKIKSCGVLSFFGGYVGASSLPRPPVSLLSAHAGRGLSNTSLSNLIHHNILFKPQH